MLFSKCKEMNSEIFQKKIILKDTLKIILKDSTKFTQWFAKQLLLRLSWEHFSIKRACVISIGFG